MEKSYRVNAEGCSLCCKLYARPGEEVRRAVLFGHGFGGHKDNRAAAAFAARMLEKNKGTALVCFDWPCHGDDVRKLLRVEDCLKTLRLVIADLRARFPGAELYGCAVSFGAYLFLLELSETGMPFERLALRCPAIRMSELLSRTVLTDADRERLRKGKTALVGFDRKVAIDTAFLESLRQRDLTKRDFLPFAERLLILHGTRDEIAPFEEARAFADENLIEFIPIEGADHRFQSPEKMNRATAAILAFFGMR